MKRNWTAEELVEHWTLLPNELDLIGNKIGPTAQANGATEAPIDRKVCWGFLLGDPRSHALSELSLGRLRSGHVPSTSASGRRQPKWKPFP